MKIEDQKMETNISLSEVAQMDSVRERINRIFTLQQKNVFSISNTTADQRIKKLKRIKDWILTKREGIHKAVYNDFRKPAAEVDLTEIYVVTSEIKHAVRHLKKWMKPRKVRRTLATITTKAWIRYEPKGVVLIISPWNFPINLTLGPMVSAIAAGNCIMLKPSEFTPHTLALIKELLTELFDENEVAIIEGEADVATELLYKPFNHIFFTGSSRVGKIVMKAAAEHLTSVTLELGGKSPVVIDETANIKDAAVKIAAAKFMNKGQACVSPDYIWVHNKNYQKFIDELKKQITRVYGETEAERLSSTSYPRIISDHHHERLVKMLDNSVSCGAKIEIGGEVLPSDKYISPTVLSNVSLDSPVMAEEIFGPILPILSFDSLEETIEMINSKEKPLAIYIFSKNKKNTEFILSNTSTGGSCINDVALHFLHLNLPFGGINNSGHGNSHGYFGFKAFSHERAVLKHYFFSPLKLLYPPYTKPVQKLIEWTVKYL
jgi:aldehyde dehydrogenase (NAD+)